MTMTTRKMVSSSVNCTSSTAARMVWVRSLMNSILIAGGIAATSLRQQRFDLVDGLNDVGARLLEHHQEHAALAVGPGCLLGVFRSGDGAADVANPQRPAIAIGDDDVVPVLRIQQLVVGVDGIGPLVAVDIALGAVDGRHRDLAADVFQRQSLGHQLGGIDLDPHRGFLLPADDDLRHAGDLADLLGELGVDRVAHRGQRQRVRGRRQQQDRGIRRVDLAVGRRRGEVLGQLAAGGVDGALHIVGGAVDVAVEIELDRDRCRSEVAGRRHLGDAGDLRELPLERLRHRGGHGFRARARQGRGDLNGREVDLRQRRHRQQRIGDEADKQMPAMNSEVPMGKRMKGPEIPPPPFIPAGPYLAPDPCSPPPS